MSFSVLWCKNGGEFLIQANTLKRQKVQGDDNSPVFEHVDVGVWFVSWTLWWFEIAYWSLFWKMNQVVSEGRQKIVEAESKASSEGSRRKHCRGRGHSVSSSRGRGSRSNDQTRQQISSSVVTPANGQLENLYHKVCLHCHI